MTLELKPVSRPAGHEPERGVSGLCHHRRESIWSVGAGGSRRRRETGADAVPGADALLNGRGHSLRRLALGAATEVYKPTPVAGQEILLGQEERVSSDFADVTRLNGSRVAVVLGDVCGKGAVAALCALQTIDVLRLILGGCAQPARALGRLNRYLCNSGLPAACPAVALSVAVLDVGTGEVVCACAGSEPPLILRADGSVEVVNAGRVALGLDARRTFRAVGFFLGAGDALLLATDGITNARRVDSGGSEDLLSFEGLAGLAQDAFGAGGPPGQMARAVLDGARALAGGILSDDASVLVSLRQ